MNPPVPRRIRSDALGRALTRGSRTFAAALGVSIGCGAVFALLGLAGFVGLARAGLTPMAIPLAGGFMLIGPALLAGFFKVADAVAAGRRPAFADVAAGLRAAPRDLWVIAALCMFLFMIWITDAGILYGFMVGSMPASLESLVGEAAGNVVAFEFYSALMGGGLAFIIFAVSAFSVPLLFYRRAGLVQAVNASVRAVFASFGPMLAWGVLLAAVTLVSILLLPLLTFTLPVLAYASHALYLEVFGEG